VFLDAFAGRIINVHPALLPAFPGVNAQRQALLHGVKVTGCTVHFVDSGVDTGRIIAQRAVPVLADDDEASLSERIHVVEHELLVEVLQEIAAGKVQPLSPTGPG
jgi:phosphoribosylglycinamide formyltransferase-1